MINFEQLVAFLNIHNLIDEDIYQLKQSYDNYIQTGNWHPTFQVFTSGWLELEGVMLILSEDITDADNRVYLSARTERSLRELLLAYPRNYVGMFRISEKWYEERIKTLFEGEIVQSESGRYFRGIKSGSENKVKHRTVSKRKDDIAATFRRLASLKGKFEHSQFVIEGDLLVERAAEDGLPIEAILYSSNFVTTSNGKDFLNKVIQENHSCYHVNDGVMGSITSTRPIPSIVASVHLNYPSFTSESGDLNFHYSNQCTLLITENIGNPDNLGITLRTADAAGVSAVLVCGDEASPIHKNCIRASRGAVGRLPMFYTDNTIAAIDRLIESGWQVIGATASAEKQLYETEFLYPTAIVVGNENKGLSDEMRERCSDLVRIPMATGQSSLNVGVAAGVLLYELSRQK